MYMQVKIHDVAEGVEGIVDAFEHIEDDRVVGYVAPSGAAIDMVNFVSPRVVYVSREELMALPA